MELIGLLNIRGPATCLSGMSPVCPSCHVSVCPSCHLYVCLSCHPSVCPSASGVSLDTIYRSYHMSVCTSCHPSVCPSCHPSVCPSASGVSLDTIYRCLNRTILYQLSRPMTAVADQTNLLDALHKLTSNRSLVFGPGNYDQEFIGCLCYCLLQLAEDPTNIRCVAVAECRLCRKVSKIA